MGKKKSKRNLSNNAEKNKKGEPPHKFDLKPGSWCFVVVNIVCLTSCTLLSAQPKDPKVVSGSASFHHEKNSLKIKTSDRAIVNWSDFSNKNGEVTEFIQPGKNSAILNRVKGSNMSLIDGKMLANGRVYLVNPNGIVIGKEGYIKASSFIASTLDVPDTDFMQKEEFLFTGGSKGKVQNFGRIEVDGEGIALLGYFVENQGSLSAPDGTVALASGQEIFLKLDGDESITIHLKKDSTPSDGTGVENNGSIESIKTELKADGNLYAMAVNHTGSIQALGVTEKNGRVLLVAEDGNVRVSGSIAAQNSDNTGGEVKILGQQIGILENALVDASGDQGGGTIYIGGGYQGNDPAILNSQRTYVDKDVVLKANAGTSGDGGTVIAWSDGSTYFYGSIDAQGGLTTGDGGFAEVSGKKFLDFTGSATLSGPMGAAGTLLLDPSDLYIANVALNTGIATYSPFPPDIIDEPDGTQTISILSSATLAAQLTTGNVIVQTSPDPVNAMAAPPPPLFQGPSAGDITWEDGADIVLTGIGSSPFSLTINAYRDFIMGATYENDGSGAFTANAGRDITFQTIPTPGMSASSPGLSSAGGMDITLNAERDINFLSTIKDITLTSTGGSDANITAGRNILAQGGSVSGNQTVAINVDNNLSFEAGGDFACLAEALGGSIFYHAANNLNVDVASVTLIGTSGGTGTAPSVQIRGDQNLTVNANVGDVLLQAGAGLLGFVSLETFTPSSVLDLQVKNGNLILTGSSTGAFISSAGSLNISVAQDCLLTGGSSTIMGVSGAATIDAQTVAYIKVDGNCIMQGGSGNAADIVDTNLALISGNLGLTLDVAKNLTLQGGAGTYSAATLSSTQNYIDVSAGGDIMLNAGAGMSAFAQIGVWDSVASTSPVDINVNVGGNLFLSGSNSQSESYALIGNSGLSFVYFTAPTSGNITINGGVNSNLTLVSGTGQDNFAQIGHPAYTMMGMMGPVTNPVSGDIRIFNFGGNVKLSGDTFGSNSSMIGHGTLSVTAPSITGSILLDGIGGNVTLDSTNSFRVQIGHNNCKGLTQGNVTVNALSGTVSLQSLQFGPSIIGHGNSTILDTPSFEGQISVNADTVLLQGGAFSDAVIGFSLPATMSSQNVSILPVSTVSVIAEHDILIQGGTSFAMMPSTAGNGVIGFLNASPTGSLTTNITLDQVRVVSNSGDISLIGQQGTAFIGTQDLNSVFISQPCQSNITIQAYNGTLSLAPCSSGTVGGIGFATIANIPTGVGAFFSIPYDVSIDVGRLVMNGAPQTSGTTGGGSTSIYASRNLDVKTQGDLILSIPTGGTNTTPSTCSISNASGVMIFDIGANLELLAGSNLNSFVQIGGSSSFSTDMVFKNVGGNVTLAAGKQATGCYAHIGNTASGFFPLEGQILFDHIGGTLSLTAGSTAGSTSIQNCYAQIGHNATNNMMSVSISGDVLLNQVDGPVYLTSGSDLNTYALIGHSMGQIMGMSTGSLSGEIFVKAQSVNLQGTSIENSNLVPDNAVIGFYLSSPGQKITVDSTQIHVEALDSITLTGSYASLSNNTLSGEALIGVLAVSPTTQVVASIDKLNVSSTNGDIVLQVAQGSGAGVLESNAVIGFFHPSATVADTVIFQNIFVGANSGNISLTGGGVFSNQLGTAFIGTQASSNPMVVNSLAASNISIQAPLGTLSLSGVPFISTAQSGTALISNATNTTSNPAPFDIAIDVGGLSVTGTPIGLMNMGKASIFSIRNLDVNVLNESDLILIAGNGIATISGNGTMTFDIDGNVQLVGGYNSVMPPFLPIAQIGSPTIAADAAGDIIFKNIGGNLSLTGGPVTNSFARIGHGSPGSKFDITAQVVIDHVGGTLTLFGGSAADASAYAQIGHYGADTTNFPLPSTIGDVLINSVDGPIQLISGNIGHTGGVTQGFFSGEIYVNGKSVELIGNGVTPQGVTTVSNSTIGFDFLTAQSPTLNSNQVQVLSQTEVILMGGDSGNNNANLLGEATIGLRGKVQNFLANPTSTIERLNVSSANGDIVLSAGIPSGSNPINPGGNAVIGYYNLSPNTTTVTMENITVSALNGNINLTGGNNDSATFIHGAAFIGTQGKSTPSITQSQVSLSAPLGVVSLSSLPNVTFSNANTGIALIANNIAGVLAPYDISIDAGGLTLVGIPDSLTMNKGGSATVYSSRNLDVNLSGDLQMLSGGAGAFVAPTNIGNASGIMTFAIGGNVIIDAGNSTAQIGNPTTFGSSDILFKSIGGNLYLTGGFGNTGFSYAQIGHGNLSPTQQQNAIGQIWIDSVGGDVKLQGGNGFSNYAQIGHVDNGQNLLTATISGDVLLQDVQGTVYLLTGQGTPSGDALIGHRGQGGNQPSNFSGKVIVNGANIQLDATNGANPSSNVTIGYDINNTSGSLTSVLIQASADNSITLIAGDTGISTGLPTIFNGNATIGVRNCQNAVVDKLNVFATNGDIALSAGIPSSGNQGANAVIGYYNQTATTAVDVVFQNIGVGSSLGNLILTGGIGANPSLSPTNPNPTGAAFIGTSTAANGLMGASTIAVSNINIQVPVGSVALSGLPFNDMTTSFGLAAISNAVNTNFLAPTVFDISINAGKLILTGGATSLAGTIAQATIQSARNLDVITVGDIILDAGVGQANIINGNGVMTFDIGANLELLGGVTSYSQTTFFPFAQIGSPFGTGGVQSESDMVFKKVGGNVLLIGSVNTGGTLGYARIGHGGAGSGAILGNIVMDLVGGNIQLNSSNAPAQIGHFGGSVSTVGDVIISNVLGEVLLNPGLIGHGGGTGSSFAGQVIVNGTSVTLGGGVSTIGYNVQTATTITSSQIQVNALDGIALTVGASGNTVIGVNSSMGSSFASANINKLNVSSTNGDIVLTANRGNSVIGSLNPPSAVTINDVSVNSLNGSIFLYGQNLGGASGGTAFIGTQGSNSESQININAPFGTLNLTGSADPGVAAFAQIFNNTQGSFATNDIFINVNGALLTSNDGTVEIYSSRNIDFTTAGDLILTAGVGPATIQNSTVSGNQTVMTFDIGGALELISSATAAAQIGNPISLGGQSDLIFKNIGSDLILNSTLGSYARIGHGLTGISQSVTGQIVVNQVGGVVSLTSSAVNPLTAQIGNYGDDTAGSLTVGDVLVNNSNGIVQLNLGLIGHSGGIVAMGSNFIGQVIVNAEAINLISSTIGYNVSGANSINSSQIQANAQDAIIITASPLGDSTIGISAGMISSASVVNKLNVSSVNGDVVLTANGRNAVIGTFNALGPITIENLNVSSTNGGIALYGQNIGFSPGGTAFIGTQGSNSQSQITINAPLGTLNMVGSAVAAGSGSALIYNSASNAFGYNDVFINVGEALLTANTQTSLLAAGKVGIFSTRNLDFTSMGDVILISGPNTGTVSIQNGTSTLTPTVMTFDIGGSLELLAGTTGGLGVGYAQIGNPINTGNGKSDIIFKNVGGDLLLNCGINPNNYARIGHGQSGASNLINGRINIQQVGGNLSLTAELNTPSPYAQIGHYGSDVAGTSTTGDIVINNVSGLISLSPGIIGHNGGFTSGSTFSGSVIVNGTTIALGNGRSTIGFDVSNTSTISSPEIQVTAIGSITLAPFNFANGSNVIGINAPAGATSLLSTINKLNVFSTNGDISLTANNAGNAVIGFFGSGVTNAVLINDLTVGSDYGGVFLLGVNPSFTSSGGTALIGTQGAVASGTQSQVNIFAPNGVLSLSGSNSNTFTGSAIIANAPFTAAATRDVLVNVYEASFYGNSQAAGGGLAEIYSGRNIDFATQDGLFLIAGSGSASIQNSSVSGNTTVMTFDIGGALELLGGTSAAQIGNPVSGGGQSDIIFKNIGGEALLNATAGAGYARIGHGSVGGTTAINGAINLEQIGGNLTLSSGAAATSIAQVGHFGATTTPAATMGDVIVNNVSGLIGLNPGIIGHNGGTGVGTFTGSVLVNGISLALANGRSTIGFDVASTGLITSPQIQVTTIDSISLSATNTANNDATIGIHSTSGLGVNALVSKLLVSSENGDVSLLANGLGSSVIGCLNPGAVSVVVEELTVSSDEGNILLYGQKSGGTSGGTALIGTQGLDVNTQSSIDIYAPLGTLSLIGTKVTNGSGNAILANNSKAISFPLDISINVGDALLQGASLTGAGGSAQIYSSRNINLTSKNDLILQSGAGTTQISNGFGGSQLAGGLMTFNVQNNVELLAGGGFAQIGNNTSDLSSILFKKIGGNLLLQGGTEPSAYAQIGHCKTLSIRGDVQINDIRGDLTLLGGNDATAYAQIGHFVSSTQNLIGVVTGDVTVKNVTGNVTMKGGTASNASAVIGHAGMGDGLSNSYTGQVLVNGGSFNISGGLVSLASATIGFEDNASAYPSIRSKQVQVTSPTSITLNGGVSSNAVIGCYNNTQKNGGDVFINNVNVISTNGDVVLNGGIPGASSADAVIGTQLNGAPSLCNIKVTTAGNILLQGSLNGGGKALIVNNQQNVSGSTNISLDPGNIILLGGLFSPSFVQIYSGNNLDINFDGRFDINYYADSPFSPLQTGTALVSANGDININTAAPSRGSINLYGPTTAGQSTQVVSILGNISIGTPTDNGAQNLVVNTVGSSGVALINATAGDFFANIVRDVSVNGSAAAAATITAGGQVEINAGRDISVGNNGNILNTGSYPLNIFAGNDVVLTGAAQNALIQTSSGSMNIGAVRDFTMNTNSIVRANGGTYPLLVTAGNSITLNGNAQLSQLGGGELTAVANRNMFINSALASITTNNNNLTLVVDNLWPDVSKYGTGFFSITPGATINTNGLPPHAYLRIFTSNRALNNLADGTNLNGQPFMAGTIFTNSGTEQWYTYWDSSYIGAAATFTVFYKNELVTNTPPGCMTLCEPIEITGCVTLCDPIEVEFTGCVELCDPIPVDVNVNVKCESTGGGGDCNCEETHAHHHNPSIDDPTKVIFNSVFVTFYEGLQDLRTYDYFMYSPVPIEVNNNCGKEPMVIEPFGSTLSCQEMSTTSYGMLRPEHRNYNTKKLEIIMNDYFFVVP